MGVGERWMPVKGYEGWYEVSDQGRVRNVKRRKSTQPGRVLKASLNSHGRPQVGLYRHGERTQARVHRLVYEAFVGSIPADKEINHIDGDPTNNRLGNLEVVTRSENMRHAFKNGLIVSNPRKGERVVTSKLRRNDVEHILQHPKAKVKALAERFDVSSQIIYDIRAGRRWAHVATDRQLQAAQDARWERASRAQRGENHPNARLTVDKVQAIRAQHDEGSTVQELSEKWGLHVEYARKIVKRIAWKHIE